jgi:hypothetical protein
MGGPRQRSDDALRRRNRRQARPLVRRGRLPFGADVCSCAPRSECPGVGSSGVLAAAGRRATGPRCCAWKGPSSGAIRRRPGVCKVVHAPRGRIRYNLARATPD